MILSSVFEMLTIATAVPLLETVVDGNEGNSRVLAAVAAALRSASFPVNRDVVVLALLAFASFLFVAHSGLMLIHQQLTAAIAHQLRREVKFDLFQRFMYARYGDISRKGRGAILHDINVPPNSLALSVTYFATLITGVFNTAILLALMVYLSWWATLLVGVVALGGIRSLRKLMDERTQSYGRTVYDLQSRQQKLEVDAVDGLKVVKAYGSESGLSAQLRGLLESEVRPTMRVALFRKLPTFVYELAASLIVIVLGTIAALRPSVGMSFPLLVGFLAAIRRCSPAVASINSSIIELNNLRPHIEAIDEALTVLEPELTGTRAVGRVEEIRFANAAFSYDGPRDSKALVDVNFAMRTGTVTGIVGPTGSGKSTIANLLVGLFVPTSGKVLVNNTDLRLLDLRDWRKKIGYVSQDIYLFNGSLRENIALWDDQVSEDEIRRAAQLAQLQDFITGLPDGYETSVGDRGLELSGGQCQRIAIARAIVRKPEILIFDEATSSLDSLTELAVYAAINQLRRNSIVVVVAHRLSTIREADQILVLDSGRIAETGNHDSLMLKSGAYSRLYQAGLQKQHNFLEAHP
jgi:ABC-type multidrug transport system fused ATPase/permease subunit